MRLALFLLSAMVVLSQTQYLRSRSRHWWTPQQRVYKNYQPAEYDDYIDDRPVYRNYRPSRPIAYPQVISLNFCLGNHQFISKVIRSFIHRRLTNWTLNLSTATYWVTEKMTISMFSHEPRVSIALKILKSSKMLDCSTCSTILSRPF